MTFHERVRRIILHCSATRPGWFANRTIEEMVREIDRWHREDRGWRMIGYHWIIGPHGEIAKGRSCYRQGAHTKGENEDSLGVCLIGGHGASADDAFEENFTPQQERALEWLIGRLRLPRDEPLIPCEIPLGVSHFGPLSLHGHNEFAAKGCPGFRVPKWAASRGISLVG